MRSRNGLLLAAGYAPAFDQRSLDDPEMQAVRDAMQLVLDGHDPYPAVVVRPDGEIVAANRSLAVLLDGVDPALLAPPMNAYRLALHPDGMAPRVTNFTDWARHVLDGLRASLRRRPDAGVERLLDELAG